MSGEKIINFGGISPGLSSYKKSRIVILPVPFEKTSSWIEGSSKGPAKIIEASCNMELYDIETDSRVYRRGIHTARAVEEKEALSMINRVYEENMKFYRDSKFPVVIGGEHTVSIGSIKACSEFFKKVSILHLDAHSDFRDSYRKDPYSHACVMARVSEFNLDIVSAGIRSMDFCEKKKLKPEKTVYAHEAFQNPRWEEKLLNALGDNVYLDIDLDVFDPSVIPATGTPEPGGLLWYQVTGLISKIARRKNIRGLSVVELCPLENNRVSEFNAAVLIYKTLSYLQSGR